MCAKWNILLSQISLSNQIYIIINIFTYSIPQLLNFSLFNHTNYATFASKQIQDINVFLSN